MLCRRLVPAIAILLAVVPMLAAQDKTFVFSTSTDEFVTIGKMPEGWSSDITMRPNSARELNLFVRNGAESPHQMRVQLLDSKGKAVTEAKLPAAGKSYSRVKFAKPMPPMPAPGAAPMPTQPMPMGPPAPPGTEFKATVKDKVRNFELYLRLFDETEITLEWEKQKGKKTREEVADEMAKNATQLSVVSILDPQDYVKLDGTPKYENNDGKTLLEINLKTEARFLAGAPCLIELVFPPQPNLDVTALGAGVYRKTVTKAGQKVKLYATHLPLPTGDEKANETVYLNIDGVPRVYTFRPNLRIEKKDPTDVVLSVTPAIRLVEDGKKQPPDKFVSLPKDRFAFRVEVDASLPSPFKIVLSRTDTAEEITSLTEETSRDERVWVEPAGEGGAFRVENRVTDWVLPLDTRDMRGKFTLSATLTATKDGPSFTRDFILDDTPPPADKIKIEGIPDKQFRGRPMKLSIFAEDPESDITKVAVFFGKPAPDGKLPEPPALIQATRSELKGGGWVVQLPVPADKKGGKEYLTAVATNGVGQSTAKTITVQLLDPPLGGTIKGVVKLGEFGKGAEGASVILKDGDGKEKDATKTGEKGKYEFTDVPPGAYTVTASKPDSAFGTKGSTPVRVKAEEKPAIADIVLTRKP